MTWTGGKTTFDDGTFTFDGNVLGIIDIEVGEEASEIDVSDTESPQGESEFLAGKTSRSISFTAFHKIGKNTLVTKSSKAFALEAEDEEGNTTNFAGNCILLTKNISGARDGAIQVAYSGRINGTMSETHES